MTAKDAGLHMPTPDWEQTCLYAWKQIEKHKEDLRRLAETLGISSDAERIRLAVEELVAERGRLLKALEPFARANRAIGKEPGPFRFETGRGHRLIQREDLHRAGDAVRAAKTGAK